MRTSSKEWLRRKRLVMVNVFLDEDEWRAFTKRYPRKASETLRQWIHEDLVNEK